MKTLPLFRTLAVAATVALALPAAPSALAHAEHGRPMHGGIVAEAAVFQGELVGAPDAPVIYLTDHGQPVATTGATGKLLVLAGGQKSEFALQPSGSNQLAPAGKVSLGKGSKVVATIRLPDGRSGALRFDVK